MTEGVRYAFEDVPSPGEVREAAQGVYWLRMPLPFKLNHINLWLLDDGDGWTVVDTGINRPEVRAAWKTVFDSHFQGKPLKRVIVTHFHPDHMGLAGWLTERFDVQLWAPMGEWAYARMLKLDTGPRNRRDFIRFYRRAGFTDDMMAAVEERRVSYPNRISPVPFDVRRIWDGEAISIGGREWRVMTGFGHSPEHASLFCEADKIMISGDQVLPHISPNISVWPQEPESNPLALYLDSLPIFKPLPEETYVLPSHIKPFTGLHARVDDLAHHHDERLEETWEACGEPRTGVEVLGRLFTRELDSHQLFFAIGESLAHLHYLVGEGRLREGRDKDGVARFERVG